MFALTLALIGIVIVVSSLLSGFVDRTGLPQVVVFLALGAVLGPYGLGAVDVTVQSPILRVVATLSLALVLFMDAVSLNVSELSKHRFLGFLVLGPGTLLTAALIAICGVWLLDMPPVLAVILGAALASTDPVLLRGIIRNPALTSPVRQALRIESGLNDVVLLPIVIIGMAALTTHAGPGAGSWAKLALNMGVLSPAAGVIVALCAIGALELVRRRTGVRRDYESIYSLGIAFAAFAAAESVHGSGFIAAFAAGLTIATLDVELCDCFIEYGETTAEMALLFTFVLFGVSLIWQGVAAATPMAVVFAIAVILIRPFAMIPSLALAKLSWRDRAILGWFGPRGLSSLLLVLLPVFAAAPGSDFLLSVCCLVVLVSVLLHGFSPMFLLRPPASGSSERTSSTPVQAQGPSEVRPEVIEPIAHLSQSEYIEPEELRALEQRDGVINADSRSIRSYTESSKELQGAVRLNPEHAVQDARKLNLPQDAIISVFCA